MYPQTFLSIGYYYYYYYVLDNINSTKHYNASSIKFLRVFPTPVSFDSISSSTVDYPEK